MLLCLCSHARPKELVMHEIQHVFQAQVTNLLEQSPCRVLVKPAEGGPPLILWVWPICIVYPF